MRYSYKNIKLAAAIAATAAFGVGPVWAAEAAGFFKAAALENNGAAEILEQLPKQENTYVPKLAFKGDLSLEDNCSKEYSISAGAIHALKSDLNNDDINVSVDTANTQFYPDAYYLTCKSSQQQLGTVSTDKYTKLLVSGKNYSIETVNLGENFKTVFTECVVSYDAGQPLAGGNYLSQLRAGIASKAISADDRAAYFKANSAAAQGLLDEYKNAFIVRQDGKAVCADVKVNGDDMGNITVSGNAAGVANNVVIDAPFNVTLSNVSLSLSNVQSLQDAPVAFKGAYKYTLSFVGENTVNAPANFAGISEGKNVKSLTVKGADEASLKVVGGTNSAGIGGNSGDAARNLTIWSGEVFATGGDLGAGIGSGSGATAVTVNIVIGGQEPGAQPTVYAVGGVQAAGIGGGSGSSLQGLIINDGRIFAQSASTNNNNGAAGIGGGFGASCQDITINNGVITALGGYRSAGIGGAQEKGCPNIVINNGVVNATGGILTGSEVKDDLLVGYGIGAGNGAPATFADNSVTINGGSFSTTNGNSAIESIQNPKDGQGNVVHKFNVPYESEYAGKQIYVRHTKTDKYSLAKQVNDGHTAEEIRASGELAGDYSRFYPIVHETYSDGPETFFGTGNDMFAFFYLGENEEHDILTNASVKEECVENFPNITDDCVIGDTTRVMWNAGGSSSSNNRTGWIYNMNLVRSWHSSDSLIYTGFQQGQKLDSVKIWVLYTDSVLFSTDVERYNGGSAYTSTQTYTLSNDSLTDANVTCETEYASKKMPNGKTIDECVLKDWLNNASDKKHDQYVLKAESSQQVDFYGAGSKDFTMFPFVLDNMDKDGVEPQIGGIYGDEQAQTYVEPDPRNDPIDIGHRDSLVYNGLEQTQAVNSVKILTYNHINEFSDVTEACPSADGAKRACVYTLVKDVDYVVSDDKATDARIDYDLTITAKSTNFVGQAKRNYVIKEFDLQNAWLAYNTDSLVFNGKDQIQKFPNVYICPTAPTLRSSAKDGDNFVYPRVTTDAAAKEANCYQVISSNNAKDLIKVVNNSASNAGTYNLKIQPVDDCRLGENKDSSFVNGKNEAMTNVANCSNVRDSIESKYIIAPFPMDSLDIGLPGTWNIAEKQDNAKLQDTLVYTGKERTQNFDVFLRTLTKDDAGAFVREEKVEAPLYGTAAVKFYKLNLNEDYSVNDNKKTEAGTYTVTVSAYAGDAGNAATTNFTGSTTHTFKIAQRDLAGNFASKCEAFAKCEANEIESADSVAVAKYGCRAVFPCDVNTENYAAADLKIEHSEMTYNAEWQENKVTNVGVAKFTTANKEVNDYITLALGTEYSIMKASDIKDHEGDDKTLMDTLSNVHMTVNRGVTPEAVCVVDSTWSCSNGKTYSEDNGFCYRGINYVGFGNCNNGEKISGWCYSNVSYDAIKVCNSTRLATNSDAPVQPINVAVKGEGNFKGIQHTAYKMLPFNIKADNLNISADFDKELVYNSQEQWQKIEVLKLGDNLQVVGEALLLNFELDNNNATNAGNYTMTVRGTNNYTGSATLDWNIARFDLSTADSGMITTTFVNGDSMVYDYMGKTQTQNVSKVEIQFVEGKKIDISNFVNWNSMNVTNAGNYDIAVTARNDSYTFRNNYSGSFDAKFTMKPFDFTGVFAVSLNDENQLDTTKTAFLFFNNEEQTQTYKVWMGKTSGAASLAKVNESTQKDNYTVEGESATDVGSYTLTVTGVNNFTGTLTAIYSIIAPNSVIVTVTAKSQTETYDGTEKVFSLDNFAATYCDVSKIEGFADMEEAQKQEALNACPAQQVDFKSIQVAEDAIAKGTNAGEYSLVLTPSTFSMKDNNLGESVEFQTTANPKLMIEKAKITVKVDGLADTVVFDNANHELPAPGFTLSGVDEKFAALFTVDDIECDECKLAARDVADKPEGYLRLLTSANFTNTDPNFDVTFDVGEPAVLVINPAEVEIKIAGKTANATYNGKEQTAAIDFTFDFVDATQKFVKKEDVKYTGASEFKKTDAGTYMAGLSADQFSSGNKNFKLTATNVEDAQFVIAPAKATVTIEGNSDKKIFAAKKFEVAGFTAKATTENSELKYDVRDVALARGADAFASGRDAGTYKMNLDNSSFVNNNTNYDVEFVVKDGELVIKPADVTVNIYGNTETVTFDGEYHEVKGYTFKADDSNFDRNDFEFVGKGSVKGKKVDEYEMGLSAKDFKSTTDNFEVTFVVKEDGKLIIEEPVAIAQVAVLSDVKVHAAPMSIVVDNAAGKSIAVFNVKGNCVYKSLRGENAFGTTTINVPSQGMYIVKVDGVAHRVNVK